MAFVVLSIDYILIEKWEHITVLYQARDIILYVPNARIT